MLKATILALVVAHAAAYNAAPLVGRGAVRAAASRRPALAVMHHGVGAHPEPAAPLAAETFAVSENTAAWKAETAAAIADKSAAEKRELQSIQEEAQAERDLMYSQREKQLTAAHKANREREVQTQTDYKGQGWEGVNALISGESKTSSDLGRMRQIITRLKHNKPAGSPSGMFST